MMKRFLTKASKRRTRNNTVYVTDQLQYITRAHSSLARCELFVFFGKAFYYFAHLALSRNEFSVCQNGLKRTQHLVLSTT